MIKVKNLTKKYGSLYALNKVSFEIPEGGFFALLGPNGAGKTTFVRILSSLTDATTGEILIDGTKVSRENSIVKSSIGIVSQHINLEREINVYKNLELHARLFGIKKSIRDEVILKQLEFADLLEKKDESISKLSGGMKRKLMIARGMLHSPKILVMDEPTVGLDVASRRRIWDYLRKLQKMGVTLILTTHYIEEAEQLCDSVAFLNHGKIVSLDTPGNLINKLGPFALDIYKSEKDLTITEFFQNRDEAINKAKLYNTNFNIRETNLEDVFVEITSEKVIK